MASSEFKSLLLLISAVYLGGTLSGLLLRRFLQRWMRPWRNAVTHMSLSLAMVGGGLVTFLALWAWMQPQPQIRAELPPVIPAFDGFPRLSFELYLDRLAAFFLLLIGVLSTLVALYSFVWLERKKERNRIAGMYNAFVLATVLLVVADNVFFFLVFLECMTLIFTYLTLYRHNLLLTSAPQEITPEESKAAAQAFKVYPVFSHIGVILITAALLLLVLAGGDASFSTLRRLGGGQTSLDNVVFLLALTGLAIKGGFTPFHPWVPVVHPFSPTTTHALTLGLVIKVASFYMLIRILFEFLSPVAWWWGALVLLIAGATALVGVFYAIISHDLKTALANHSVENLGIILAGVGLALLLSATDYPGRLGAVTSRSAPALAGLALMAALYHLLNHTAFKSLLYLCTGAIENHTGTVDLEELGGLVHRLPWTSITFLIGAIAIAGLPPLNGFVSEWLTLQTVFAAQGFLALARPWVTVSIILLLLMLGLAFGLTALAFVKIAGQVLLGAPRRPEVVAHEKQKHVPWRIRLVLASLALACLLLGLFPGWVAEQLALIPQDLLTLSTPLSPSTSATSIKYHIPLEPPVGSKSPEPALDYQARLAMLPLLAGLGAPALLALLLSSRLRRLRRGEPWTCATAYRPEAMQISGSAFSFMIWSWLQTRKKASAAVEQAGEGWLPWRLDMSPGHSVRAPFRFITDTAVNWAIRVSERFGDWFQGGDIRQYLTYLFLAFLALVLAVLWKGR